MLRLALGNVFLRRMRAFLSVLAIAVEVSLVLLLIGLSTGTLSDVGERIEKIQSDVIVLPPGAQYVLGMSTAVMPLEPVRNALETTDGVVAAAPVTFTTTNRFGSYGVIFGIDPRTYGLVGRGALRFLHGEQLDGPHEMVVDSRLAEANDLEVGQEVELLNQTFRISGIVEAGSGVRMYMSIATVQELIGRQGKASAFFVRLADPARVGEVLDSLRRNPAFKGYSIVASSQYAELLGTYTPGIKEYNAAITVIAVTFGFIVIALSMYTTIIERTRQIGILKSLGAGNGFIISEVMLEAVLLSAIGIPAGFLLASAIRQVLRTTYPTLIIAFSPEWMLNAALLAIGSGILGSLYPAYRASSVDPVAAMSYE